VKETAEIAFVLLAYPHHTRMIFIARG